MVPLAMRLGCALLSALGLAALLTHPSPVVAATPPATYANAEMSLLVEVNGDRAAIGLDPLAIDPQLTRIARYRARYLVAHHAFTHCADLAATCPPSGYHFGSLLQRAGIAFTLAGENLAEDNAPTAQLADRVHADWMESPLHREQIVNPAFNATGFGVVCCTTITDDQGTTVGDVSVAVEIFAQEAPLRFGALRARG